MTRAAAIAVLVLAGPLWAGPEESVVKVRRADGASGTGSVLHSAAGESLVVTNKHVAPEKGAGYKVVTRAGTELAAEWVAADADADLAVLRVKAALPVLALAETGPAKGATVVLWGLGGGFRHGAWEGPGGRIPDGTGDFAGFDFSSIPGDSGAPLTADGKVVGVCWGNNVATGHGRCCVLADVRRVRDKYAPAAAAAKAKPAVQAPVPPAVPPVVSAPHAGELKAALADARKLDGPTAARTRYLTLYAVPERDRDRWRTVVTFWANGLSREAEFARPRRVTATVYAVAIDDYGWQAQTWEKLADEDPYFHVILVAGGKRVAALATWLPAAEAAELVKLTQSAAPLVRGDWWFSRAAIQFGRQGTGYYDWLQTKDRDAFDRLVGLNVKESQRVKREVAGIVARSGVANFPRQVFRFQSVTGGYWQTRDRITDNKDAGNAVRQLDEDYKHEAEEIYGVLPNGLFAFFLANAQGVRQDSAPDGIGFDAAAPGRDGKIHVGKSCAGCHVEGLRPIADWGRRVYRGPLALSSPDPDRLRRLTQLYLGELAEWYEDDNAAYAKRLKRLTGWAPAEAAKAVAAAWAWYQEADLLPADVAAELGLAEAAYLERLRGYYAANKLSDPVLASHLARPPIPIRRDDVEQLMPLVAPVALAEVRK